MLWWPRIGRELVMGQPVPELGQLSLSSRQFMLVFNDNVLELAGTQLLTHIVGGQERT